MADALESIGASDATTTGTFREMNQQELVGYSFSDSFRFSFTMRIDRDVALALSRKLELLVSELAARDCRVYLGVLNH